MKSYSFILAMILSFVFISHDAQAHISHADIVDSVHPPRWEKLGQRRVNYGLDRDEILVTAREGRFTALRLRAEIAPINLHRVVVHYANGNTQEINVGQVLRPGTNSPVLNLPGNRRIITKVVFWYDTRNLAARRGRVELWGRH